MVKKRHKFKKLDRGDDVSAITHYDIRINYHQCINKRFNNNVFFNIIFAINLSLSQRHYHGKSIVRCILTALRLMDNFSTLKKCKNKFECPCLYKLCSTGNKLSLKVQSDWIHAKLFYMYMY